MPLRRLSHNSIIKEETTSPVNVSSCKIDKSKDISKPGNSLFKKRPVRRHHTIGTMEDVTTLVQDGMRTKKSKQELMHSISYSPTTEQTFNLRRAPVLPTESAGINKAKTAEEPLADRVHRSSITYGHRQAKTNFQSMTNRVTSLLKGRTAFLPRRSSKEEDSSAMDAVEHLPKTPRFSSSLSAEAQYALMKGYEDIIADTITKKHPEFNTIIKRNKTPHHNIAISDKCFQKSDTKRNPDKEEDAKQTKLQAVVQDQMNSKKMSTFAEIVKGKQSAVASSSLDSAAKLQKPSSQAQDQSDTTSTPLRSKEALASCLENIRRLSLAFPILATNKSDNDDDDGVLVDIGQSDRQPYRRHSVYTTAPSSVPRERQIVLSHRLERAMDLVDTMRPQWENTLSPRITGRREAPVGDYNHWADQWAKEFKINVVN
ncbi:hypothetical protein Btru_019883 [Bulinus truncatus]|nr:hypothetical protein Btru_019883 [Bulinus truncatus]